MGDFSMTCSISGLGISGGTPVRCLLLTASPYGDKGESRGAWIVRTPPLRAIYNSYGTIEDVHPEDKFIADLWLRGLREDLVERGQGDNAYHDLPTSKHMSFDDLLDALRAGRVLVRQDVRRFWRRQRRSDKLDLDEICAEQTQSIPRLRKIEAVLSADATLCAQYPDPVASSASPGKFVVDEPVPHLVRVRFGHHLHGVKLFSALEVARAAVERSGFIGVVAAGSGRYGDEADLVVLPTPNAKQHVAGPQWDMACGQASSDDKQLAVALAMVREDVWQAVSRYPHSEGVALDCTACGQQSCYHDRERVCPSKSINAKPYKKHARGTTYTHGPVFPDGVEHVVVPRAYGETVWYDLAAFRHGSRQTWQAVLDHFSGKKSPSAEAEDLKLDEGIAAMMKSFEKRRKKEAARIAALPAEARAKLEAEQQRAQDVYDAEERDKKERPIFSDFEITDTLVADFQAPGAWVFRDRVPGIIALPAHLSMCLADKREVPLAVIDAIAELSAVTRAMHGVGVTWKPARSTGPQYPEWDEHARFAHTVAEIAEASARKRRDVEEDGSAPRSFATLDEVEHTLYPAAVGHS